MKKPDFRSIIITVIALVLFIGGYFLFDKFQKKSSYEGAIALMNDGDLEDAYIIFSELYNYEDSKAMIAKILETDPVLPFRNAEVGGQISFGQWEQDNDTANGPEQIEWFVLDSIDGRLLLLSEQVLDGKPYNDASFAAITWEDSSLRNWLNSEFLNQAFSETEQNLIPTVRNRNEDQSAVGTEGGKNTSDRVFLLSETEARAYLSEEMTQDTVGRAQATTYAASHGVETDEEGYASWWLRSPGVYPYSAQFIDQEGKLYLSGAYTDIDYQFGVRPSIWIDLTR